MMKLYHYGGRSYLIEDLHLFNFEIGRYESAYQQFMTFKSYEQAKEFYDNYQVTDGYKKRLKIVSATREFVIAKKLSDRT